MSHDKLSTHTHLQPSWTVSTIWSSRPVIGSGHSYGDHVTYDFADTCCHRQEIHAFPSSCWYRLPRLDVTLLLPTTPIPVSAPCIRRPVGLTGLVKSDMLFTMILNGTSESHTWSLPFRFRKYICRLINRTIYHFHVISNFYHLNNIWWRTDVMKLSTILFPIYFCFGCSNNTVCPVWQYN